MPKYYFFTDTDLLQQQTTAAQAYGPQGTSTGQDIFQGYNLHTVGAGAKAYAVCEGIIVAQEVTGNPNLLNIVLKPIEPIKNGLPPVKYFIYRGISKASLLDTNGNLLSSTDTNTLLYHTIDIQTKYNAQFGTTATASGRNIGLDYKATAIGADQLLDTATLESLFNKDNADIQLPKVTGGWILGEWESSVNIGLEIVFEQLDKPALTFAAVRAQHTSIQVSSLGVNPTQAEIFEQQHDKEEILRYLDDAAFWSAFYGTKLLTKTSADPNFTAKRKAAIYDTILVKYYNKNRVYLDIRNNHNHAYNYYGNYSNTLKIAYDDTSSLNNKNYATPTAAWPLLILEASDFPAGNTSNQQLLRLSLPQGDNTQPLLYLWCAQTPKSFPRVVKRRQQKFQELEEHASFSNYTTEIELVVPNKANNTNTTILSSYIRLKYIKRLDQNQSTASSGTVLRSAKALDHLFMPLQMEEAFQAMNGGAAAHRELYTTFTYVDAQKKTNQNYIGNIGLAKTDTHTTLFTLAREHHATILGAVANVFSSIGKKIGGDSNVLEAIVGATNDNKAAQTTVLQLPSGTTASYVDIKDNAEDYVFDFTRKTVRDILALTLTNAQYTTLLQAIQTNFGSSPKYPVYLTTNNHNSGVDLNGIAYEQFELWLSGLKEQTGTVQVTEITTGITLYEAEEPQGETITCPTGTNPVMDAYDRASLLYVLARNGVGMDYIYSDGQYKIDPAADDKKYRRFFDIDRVSDSNYEVDDVLNGVNKLEEKEKPKVFQIAEIAFLTAVYRVRNELYNKRHENDTRAATAVADYVVTPQYQDGNNTSLNSLYSERDIPQSFFGANKETPVERAASVTEFTVYQALIDDMHTAMGNAGLTVTAGKQEATDLVNTFGLMFSADASVNNPDDNEFNTTISDVTYSDKLNLIKNALPGATTAAVQTLIDQYYITIRRIVKERAEIIFKCLDNTFYPNDNNEVRFDLAATGDGGSTVGLFPMGIDPNSEKYENLKTLSTKRAAFAHRMIRNACRGLFPYKTTIVGQDIKAKFQQKLNFTTIGKPSNSNEIVRTQIHFYISGIDNIPRWINKSYRDSFYQVIAIYKKINNEDYVFYIKARSGNDYTPIPVTESYSYDNTIAAGYNHLAEIPGVSTNKTPTPRTYYNLSDRVRKTTTYIWTADDGTILARYIKGSGYDNFIFEEPATSTTTEPFEVTIVSACTGFASAPPNESGTGSIPDEVTDAGFMVEDLVLGAFVTKAVEIPSDESEKFNFTLNGGFIGSSFIFEDSTNTNFAGKTIMYEKLTAKENKIKEFLTKIHNSINDFSIKPRFNVRLYGNGAGTFSSGNIVRATNQTENSSSNSSLRVALLDLSLNYEVSSLGKILKSVDIEINAFTDPVFAESVKKKIEERIAAEWDQLVIDKPRAAASRDNSIEKARADFARLYLVHPTLDTMFRNAPQSATNKLMSDASAMQSYSVVQIPDYVVKLHRTGTDERYKDSYIDFARYGAKTLGLYGSSDPEDRYGHSTNMILSALRAFSLYEEFLSYLLEVVKGTGFTAPKAKEFVEDTMISNVLDKSTHVHVGVYRGMPFPYTTSHTELLTEEGFINALQKGNFYHKIDYKKFLSIKNANQTKNLKYDV